MYFVPFSSHNFIKNTKWQDPFIVIMGPCVWTSGSQMITREWIEISSPNLVHKCVCYLGFWFPVSQPAKGLSNIIDELVHYVIIFNLRQWIKATFSHLLIRCSVLSHLYVKIILAIKSFILPSRTFTVYSRAQCLEIEQKPLSSID